MSEQHTSKERFPFYGHDDGLVIEGPDTGFKQTPMTPAQLAAREPALAIAQDIYRFANYAGVCYVELWGIIAKAIQGALDARAADEPPAVDVAPIAKLTVRDGLVQRAGLYAPGLPDGDHDVFPVELRPHVPNRAAPTKSEIPAAAQSAANSGQCESRKAAQSGTAAGASVEKSACTCPPGMCCEKSGAAPSEIRQCRDAVEPSSVAVNEPVFYRCETCKEIMLAAHLVGTDSHERIEETSEGQPYQVTCGPVRPSVLSAGEYINRFLPANWMNDSSLETWFPITAEELKRLKDERAAQPPSDAARDVIAERERQKNVEGWTPEHDDEHSGSELPQAAACYALGRRKLESLGGHRVDLWPWEDDAWKPRDRRRNLVRAGALILAEIERLDRASPT